MAQKYVRPDEAVIVAVGDRSKIEPELQKLNLGPIEIRDPEGN
jgi:zinc protease